MIRKAPNINHLWARLIIEELVRCGVTQFFLAPGSRSTPLVTAVALHEEATSVVHFDERGTAFAALGYARATGKPAAWITTSGTALANGLPAVIEASADGIPLIMLTADRPPELRFSGANQTIKQPGIYQNYVQWAFDGPPPDTKINPTVPLTTVDQAVFRSRNGSVHLNWMFREPLAPVEEDISFDKYLAPLANWIKSSAPYTWYPHVAKIAGESSVSHVIEQTEKAKQGVIIAGRMSSFEEGQAILKLAEALKWPLFTDVGSQLQFGTRDCDWKILHYNFLVNNPVFSSGPDVVLQFGRQGTSKKLDTWLRDAVLKHYILVDNYQDRLDPMHKVTCRIEADIADVCKSLLKKLPGVTGPNAWCESWIQKNALIDKKMEALFQQSSDLSEPAIARSLSECLFENQGLALANSMPVRDMDVFGIDLGRKIKVILNRGASGIDGTLATAIGAVWGMQQPVTLLIGDLSLLHDLNSLALLKDLPFPLVIVVVNNDGGGIFSFLPISSYKELFESHFAAPHGLNFKPLAKMFGLAYNAPANLTDFKSVYRKALASGEHTLIEVQTDREDNLTLHKTIEAFLAAV